MAKKWFEGHLGGMFRKGFRELRELTMPFPDAIAKEEYGVIGTPTPGEIAKDREPDREPPELEIGG